MERMTKLKNVAERVDQLSANCFDENVPVSDISFESLDKVNIGTETHAMKPIAQRSISNRLGIPYQYLKKCPEDIQAYNMNHWIHHEKNENLFFRFDGEEVRAIFTPKYIPVDNFEVLERLDSLGYGPETDVQCDIDGEFMSLSLMDGERSFDLKGDKFRPGISVSNSEVGLASLSIAAFILRLVCTNGLISKTDMGVSYRHVSMKILTDFPDIIERLSNELSAQKSQLKFSMDSKVDNPQATIESFNRQFQLKQEERDAVEWAWPHESGGMMFNIVQTYTRSAQYSGLNPESSHRLMRAGGSILGMVS